MRRHRSGRKLVPLAMALAVVAGCSDNGTGPNAVDLNDYITAVATANGSNIQATYHTGAATQGSGPAVNATGTSAMITGGSSIRTLSATTAFNHVVVAIQGVPGYWDLTLPSTVTTTDIILTMGQTLPANSFTVQYGAGTGASIGTFDTEPVSVVTVGTGDVQVSVSWDAESDVDLHLVEPGGQDIYYGNDVSTTGGTLDLDSNAGCYIDGKKNENITWPAGKTPPHGTFTVRVDYWSACSLAKTNYVVTVRVKGQAVRTFTGSFTGTGDQGGSGSGTTITTFTY